MRRAVLAVLVGIMLWAGAGAAFGATGSARATADLAVASSLTATVYWVSTGTDAIDFGTVPVGTTLSDELFLHVLHNMGGAQQFSLSGKVSKNAGGDWEDEVTVYDYVETLGWTQADFDAIKTFSTPIGGSTQNFSISLPATIEVGGEQSADIYQFEFTLIVTSI